MVVADSPVWRRAFDDVERRVGSPLKSVTSSPDFQLTVHQLRQVGRAVTYPVENLLSWGLHVAGLPSHADMRGLRRQLDEVQRELLALRRQIVESERARETQQ